ncbi:MAG: stage II sporulation protein P [Firmicutes bacterium]|nr:stage II sporulation protein P [Bacillota bacterium]
MRRWFYPAIAVFLCLWLCSLCWREGAALIFGVWSPKEVLGSCLSVPPEKHGSGFSLFLIAACKFITQVDPANPGLLRSVLPAIDQVESVAVVAPAKTVSRARTEKEAAEPPLVAIYNTHTGETYALTDGVDRVKGRGGVVQVAAALEEELKNKGVMVFRSDKVHDASYAISYLESEKTVRDFLYSHPGLDAIFDVHRDSKYPRTGATVNIDGQNVARVLIVVGSDARQPFPTWRENLEFAKRIAARADALYPGLCRGVRVKGGRYNQFLSPRVLLLEIGCVNNTIEEAEAAAKLFACVLADVLRDKSGGTLQTPELPEPWGKDNSGRSEG